VPRKNWRVAAALVWPVLATAAKHHAKVTYGDLAPLIPTSPRAVGRALNPIQDFCLDHGLPPLTAIVVAKATRRPGDGFIAAVPGGLEAAQRSVFSFDWSEVRNPFDGSGAAAGSGAVPQTPPVDLARVSAVDAEAGWSGVTPVTAEDLAARVRAFDDDWGAVDEILYRVCREHPDHTSRRSIMAKLILIGRTYAAGIERLVTPPKGKQAVELIGDCLERHGVEVDAIITGLDGVAEPLTSTAMRLVVRQHGRLTSLLANDITAGKSPRSFVSKYLHFHMPVVPIYDSYCDSLLTRLVPWDADAAFDPPEAVDGAYYHFCVRFLRLCEACRGAGIDATVKDLDAFLWQVPA